MNKSLNMHPVKSEKYIIIESEEDIPYNLINKYYLRNGANSYIKTKTNIYLMEME